MRSLRSGWCSGRPLMMGHFCYLSHGAVTLQDLRVNGMEDECVSVSVRLKVRDSLIMFPSDCNSRSTNEIYGDAPAAIKVRQPRCKKRIDDAQCQLRA